MDIQDMRETLLEEWDTASDFMLRREHGWTTGAPPPPFLFYIAYDADVSLYEIGVVVAPDFINIGDDTITVFDDTREHLVKSIDSQMREQIENASDPQIRFYMQARGVGMEWV